MTLVRTQEDIDLLRKHVQNLLDKRMKRRNFRLKVTRVDREEDEWTYFIVSPTRRNVRVYDYADVLSDVEIELRRDEKLEGVLLVPSIGEEGMGQSRPTGKRGLSDKVSLSVPRVPPRRTISARSRGRGLPPAKKEVLRGHGRIKQASA
jgi:hypothetical protein